MGCHPQEDHVAWEDEGCGSFFSGGDGSGTVRPRRVGKGSKETFVMECSMLLITPLIPTALAEIESGENGAVSAALEDVLRAIPIPSEEVIALVTLLELSVPEPVCGVSRRRDSSGDLGGALNGKADPGVRVSYGEKASESWRAEWKGMPASIFGGERRN